MKHPGSVCILDYGSGNVRSLGNIISYLGFEVSISNSPQKIEEASHLILPGVGAYGEAMNRIRKSLPIPLLENEVIQNKKPFLGICVGMQVLSNFGNEHGRHAGLGWVSGEVDRVDSHGFPLPHMGWNDIEIVKDEPLFRGATNIRDFYFLHSYCFIASDESDISSYVKYGSRFCASIQKNNIFGVQFHPEKSQEAGLMLLKNFLEV